MLQYVVVLYSVKTARGIYIYNCVIGKINDEDCKLIHTPYMYICNMVGNVVDAKQQGLC